MRFSTGPAVSGVTLIQPGASGKVFGLDAGIGSVRWEQSTGSEIEVSPIIVGDQVIVLSCDNHVYVFRLADGALLAKTPFADNAPTRAMRSFPAYHRQALWIGGTTNIKSGSVQRWERKGIGIQKARGKTEATMVTAFQASQAALIRRA